jgi:hypothetical protein
MSKRDRRLLPAFRVARTAHDNLAVSRLQTFRIAA